MTLSFSATLVGPEIHCWIGSDVALSRPTFCFSLMKAARVVSGGILTRSVAGYAEVALPDLQPGTPAHVVLAHAAPGIVPRNRAWLPLGAYLRAGDQCLALPPLPAGVGMTAAPGPLPLPADCLPLIPQPATWQPASGTLGLGALHTQQPQLLRIDALAGRLTLNPFVAASGIGCDVIHDTDLPKGAYRLTITPDRVQIQGDDTGIFHAGITLLNLRETCSGHIPCGVITDAPRFDWRGQHLDCARHFFSVDTILRLLDLMALFKLNRFHWHFADDEAFRLEVTSFPDLWRKTAFRGEGCAIPGVFGGGIRAGGSYSATDVARVLARAAELHIKVLPEIEVPAHAFAVNKAVPGLRDPADNGAEISVQDYSDNVINPALPATWAFLEPLVDEVADIFGGGILHLGCDELPPGAWEGSPLMRRLMAENGLQTPHDVQGWMMARLAGYLQAKGVRAAAWEEAAKGANGGLGHDALLFSWTGQGPGIAAARRGHDVVMCPAQNVYFDLAHSAEPDDWGATWAGVLPLEQTVAWRALPEGASDVAQRIVGVQGCFWGEFTTEDHQMEPMLCPRILGLATKAWDMHDRVDGPLLRAISSVYGPVFDRIGWQWNRAA
ncbi:MAG: hypothetical protein RLZZ437_1780 [Pseudomonadota bacterium]|jgi:hexosaminidase